jgi:hypothetical protein
MDITAPAKDFTAAQICKKAADGWRMERLNGPIFF